MQGATLSMAIMSSFYTGELCHGSVHDIVASVSKGI